MSRSERGVANLLTLIIRVGYAIVILRIWVKIKKSRLNKTAEVGGLENRMVINWITSKFIHRIRNVI